MNFNIIDRCGKGGGCKTDFKICVHRLKAMPKKSTKFTYSHAAYEKAKSEASDLGIPVQQHLEIVLEQIRLDQVFFKTKTFFVKFLFRIYFLRFDRLFWSYHHFIDEAR